MFTSIREKENSGTELKYLLSVFETVRIIEVIFLGKRVSVLPRPNKVDVIKRCLYYRHVCTERFNHYLLFTHFTQKLMKLLETIVLRNELNRKAAEVQMQV